MKRSVFKNSIPFYFAVIGIHLLGILLIAYAAGKSSNFWGLGLLAYSLGLRHAFDADHIAAIDNTVRKLIHQRKKSCGVGFFFSLGHSTVVFLMVVLISISLKWIKLKLPLFQSIGGLIGSLVSGVFLIGIAIVNLIVLISLWRSLKSVRQNAVDENELNKLLLSRGFLLRLIYPLFKFINHEWQMYLIGFLFGLGFDTASEIGLIAISATAAQANAFSVGILALPILFAAGMNLMDTTDSVMMAGAYSWAFATPERKTGYNLIVTSISTTAAFAVGFLELVQVLASTTAVKGKIIQVIEGINLNWLGYGLFILFIVIWSVSYLFWHFYQNQDVSIK
ncbi:high-affinity nickel permease [Liquorilactobacillus ghanensis DSM 18630]|uniref:Nickel/cobalt efflux system n=1 Tax=Liquorilactobacillus ghanensis DSM 18630 TaxID=1423750 RepID=A0A0R1VS49_9LACO|nr:HoxN/HupN/NixA family nickel/cobalt transporter [Liquorilactobacillus ghanensis]KRM06180.1 high-affinity nickel permease [Liquorilactobacillus ghanensis DSM 18630]